MRSDPTKRQQGEVALVEYIASLEAEVARPNGILGELGFCPRDGDTMPCLTCGAGL